MSSSAHQRLAPAPQLLGSLPQAVDLLSRMAKSLARTTSKFLETVSLAARVPPAWTGYRYVQHESLETYLARAGDHAGVKERIHAPVRARNPLPCNVSHLHDLPASRGWFGFSFRDVPSRESGETFLAYLRDTRIATYRDAAQDVFHPALLTPDDRALDLRQSRFRPRHAQALRPHAPQHIDDAIWILERAYDNHSHWLTAHLPKLLLLESLDRPSASAR